MILSLLEESLERIPGMQGLSSGRTLKLREGERRRTAVLFLDLKGFTSISEKLDHEVVHSLVSGVMGVLSRVVEAYGGYVDKFEGDRIMALFGARVAAENDSARAVGSALRMLSVLEELGPVFPDGSHFSARIGIDFGPVTVGPDPSGHLTAIGGVTNLASRIEEMAEVGTVLVTRSVRDQCGDLFRWEDLGEVEVRGLAAPAHVFRPGGPGDAYIDRWQRAERLAGSPLVGRDPQIRLMRDALERAAAGSRGSMVLLEGDAGIGKSRLIHDFTGTVPGVRVLRGHALAYAQPPYWLWISMIRDCLGIESEGPELVPPMEDRLEEVVSSCPDTRRACVLETSIPLLSRLVSLGHLGYHSSSTTEHEALKQAQMAFLMAACSSGDVVLVLEDLHWADEGSLEVLRELLCLQDETSPLLVLATSRPPAPEFGTSVTTIGLGPLDTDSVRRVACYILSADEETVSPRLVEFVTEVGKGNPFVVEELVLGLLDTGAIHRSGEGEWSLVVSPEHIEIPSSIRAISQARIDRLPVDERKLLQYSSVLGIEFSSEVLGGLLDELSLTGFDCAALLSSLVSKGFLVETDPGRFTFRHSLIQRSAYGTLLRHNLRLLHRAAALALEKLYTPGIEAMSPVIFAHWEAAGDRDRMVVWGSKALAKIYASGQTEESMRIAEKIIDWTEDSDLDTWYDARQRAKSLKRAVMMMRGESDMGSAIIAEMIRHAREKGDPNWELDALRARAQLQMDRGEFEEMEDTLRKAMELARKHDLQVYLARLKITMADYLSDTTRSREAEEYYLEGIDGLEEYGEPEQVGTAIGNLSNLYGRIGRNEESRECAEKAVRIHEAVGDLHSLGYGLNGVAVTYAMDGDIDTAEEYFNRALQINRKVGNTSQEGVVLGNLGIVAKIRGDFDTAIERYEQAVEIAGKCCNQRSHSIALANLANLLHMTGSDERAEECARDSLRISAGIRDMSTVVTAGSILGLILLDTGRRDEAVECYDAALRVIEEFDLSRPTVEDFDNLRDALEAEGIETALPSCWADGDRDTG